MKNKFKKTIFNIVKQIVLGLVVFAMIFPYSTLVALADPVPVEEVGWNREWNFRTSEYTNSMVELLGEIMGPIYQLATPGSYLTKDIYRYIMKTTESELGIDKDFFRRMQKKQEAPTVDIVFAPTNPKVGEKVTAFAIPRGFRNSNEKLYYTWYIVHKGEKNVEVGRKEAMRIVAAGNYDEKLWNPEIIDDDGDRDAYNASIGGDNGVGKKSKDKECDDSTGCDCIDSMTMMDGEISDGCYDNRGELLYSSEEEYEESKDDRGTESANLGRGVINSDFITRCYRHNFGIQNNKGEENSGRDLIISCKHTFGNEIGTDDKAFDFSTEQDLGTNPTNADTDGDGVMDEADLVGLGQDEFTWIYREGDKVSVAIEGMSNIAINEGTTVRLRYKNKKNEKNLDVSPEKSPEDWYTKKRTECQDLRASSSNNDYSDCMKELWEHERDKKKNDEDAFGDMTSYYKIMWATPGICTEGVKDEAENDWCDNDSDRGFQYLKLYDPVEKGKQLMEVSVNVSPKNPQFKEPEEDDLSEEHSDSTDRIIASASVVSQDNINPDYLYYKWSVWRCDKNNFDKCEDMTDELTDNPKFRSNLEGLGLRDMWFYPDDFLIDENRTLLKIGVIVKKHKNSVMSSPGINGGYSDQIFSEHKKENFNNEEEYVQKYAYSASKLIEITRHTMNIKLYQAEPLEDGGWKKGKEICGEDSEIEAYRKICPVYQYQVLMAEVENAGEAISWQLNGKNLGQTLNGLNNQNPNSTTIFFPITGNDKELGTIKATSEIENQEGSWEDDNISEARIFSIHRPMAKIVDKENELDATSIQRAFAGTYSEGRGYYRTYKNDELWWMLEGAALDHFGRDTISHIDIPITLIPRYMTEEIDDKNLTLQAYVGKDDKGSMIPNEDDQFEGIGFNSVLDRINNLKIRTIRQFSQDHLTALKESFGINPPLEIVHDLNVKVKVVSAEGYTRVTGNTVALSTKEKAGKFFASTIKNSPEYLVFILRLAVSFVLVAMMAFGLVYSTRKIS